LITIVLSLFISYFKIGLFSFGGGYAMLPLMEKEIIDVHQWLNTSEFIDIIAVAEMTPGPIAINSATFVGYRVGGLAGSLAATMGVIFPSLIILIAAISFLARFRHHPRFRSFLEGLRPAVIALICLAAVFVSEEAFIGGKGWKEGVIAAATFVLIMHTRLHPIIAIVLAAAAGILIF